MAGDLIRETRQAVIIHAAGDPTVTELVPASSIHPSTTPANPAWPFTRFDGPQSLPLDLSCVAGATVTFLLHAFAKDRLEGGVVVETAEDHASRIASALKLSLHNRRLPIAGTAGLIRVRSIRSLRDGDEQSAWHAILSCEARILAA